MGEPLWVLEALVRWTRVGVPGGGGAVEVMVMAALADLVASDTEVAVRETEAGAGTLAGAV